MQVRIAGKFGLINIFICTVFFSAFTETNDVWTISGRDVVTSQDLIFSWCYKSSVIPLKNGQIW